MKQSTLNISLAVAFTLTVFIPATRANPGTLTSDTVSTGMESSLSSSENVNAGSKLRSFSAAFEHRSVTLSWSIDKIQNANDHFEIERSLDGIHFEKAGLVNSTEQAGNNYQFTEKLRPALTRNYDLYYRLKQSAADGRINYSKTLILRAFESKSVEAISVTPDPALNNIQVNVQLKENSFVVMKVADKTGNQVVRKAMKAAEGFNSFTLEGSGSLRKGNYTLEIIINSNERMTMTLVKE